MLTKITGFDITQVDVAQRTSKKENASIIMLLNKISDSTNFFKQKKKFHNLQTHQFQSTQLVDEEVTLPGIGKKRGEETSDNESLIFPNESLTSTYRILLKEAKEASRQHNYKYKVYIELMGRSEYKKKNDQDDHIAKLCTKDLEKNL